MSYEKNQALDKGELLNRTGVFTAPKAPASILPGTKGSKIISYYNEKSSANGAQVETITDFVTLLDKLSEDWRRQQLYIDTLGDAAHQAVNQVQDIQLEMIKAGPEISATDVFIDVAISLCLVPNIVGPVIKKVTQGMIERILRTRWAFQNFSSAGGLVTDPTSWTLVVKNLLRNSDVKELYSDLPFRVADKLVDQSIRAYPKIAKIKREPHRIIPLDTPGSSVLNSVLSFVRKQKMTNDLIYDYWRNRIVMGAVDDKGLEFLEKLLDKNLETWSHPYTLSLFKGLNKNFFEQCIWSRILVNPKDKRIKYQGVATGRERVLNQSKAFTDYAIRRFIVFDRGIDNRSFAEVYKTWSESVGNVNTCLWDLYDRIGKFGMPIIKVVKPALPKPDI